MPEPERFKKTFYSRKAGVELLQWEKQNLDRGYAEGRVRLRFFNIEDSSQPNVRILLSPEEAYAMHVAINSLLASKGSEKKAVTVATHTFGDSVSTVQVEKFPVVSKDKKTKKVMYGVTASRKGENDKEANRISVPMSERDFRFLGLLAANLAMKVSYERRMSEEEVERLRELRERAEETVKEEEEAEMEVGEEEYEDIDAVLGPAM